MRPLFLRPDVALAWQEQLRSVLQLAPGGRAPMPEGFWELEDLPRHLHAPLCTAFARPDCFWDGERFWLSELNCGNGGLISLAYCDLLCRSLHVAQQPLRALQSWLSARIERASLCWHAHPDEWKSLGSFPERIRQVVKWAWRDFQKAGFGLSFQGPLEQVGGIMRLGIGEAYLHQLPSLKSWLGDTVAGIPHFFPLAGLALGKGLLPWLYEQGAPVLPSYSLRSRWCEQARREPADWVLKSSFQELPTQLGHAQRVRPWNRTLESQSIDWILQRRFSLQSVRWPYSPDGKTIEWGDFLFEYSPFLLEGQIIGGMVRYLPAHLKLPFSPAPPELGFGVISIGT